MAISQSRSRLSASGSLYRPSHKKKKHELGRYPTLPKLGQRKFKTDRVLGGNIKQKLLSVDMINVIGKDGKASTLKINRVVENPANRNYARRNILTAGTIVETEKGKVRITSRPGQHPVVNGVLV